MQDRAHYLRFMSQMPSASVFLALGACHNAACNVKIYKIAEFGGKMRIIAGSARGRKIEAPEGLSTRPTLDRVKESLFGSIQFDLGDAFCLDLFAGSGNLGIEAISRGAGHTVFVDHDRKCTSLISSNLKLVGFSDKATVIFSDAFSALERFSREKRQFDIVFLDPPYALGLIPDVLKALLELDLLAPHAIIVAEHSVDTELTPPETLKVQTNKRFHDTAVTIMRVREVRE